MKQQKNEQIRELEKINRDLLNGNQNQAYLLRGSNLNKSYPVHDVNNDDVL